MSNFDDDSDLALALQLSREEAEKDHKRRFGSEKKGKDDKDNELAGMGEVEVNKLHSVDFNPQTFGTAFQTRMLALVKSNPYVFADVTLVVGPKEKAEKIPAHRIILCAWSNNFRAMLENETWKEASQKELVIDLEEKKVPFFKKLLSYIYTGKIDEIPYNDLIPMLELCDFYGVLALKEQCEEILGKNVDEDNIFGFLDLVKTYNCKKLNQQCAVYFAKNFKKMAATGTIYQAEPMTFVEIIKSDDLEIATEEDLFKILVKYAEKISNEEERIKTLEKCLPFVRFAFLGAEFLLDYVEECGIVQKVPVFKQLLHDTYKYKAYPSVVPPLLTIKPRKSTISFDKKVSSPNIKLSSDRMIATSAAASAGLWTSARTFPALEGLVYREFEVTFASYMMLGVDSESNLKTVNQYPGQTAHGWSLYSAGQMYHANTTSVSNCPYTSGDKIGILFDSGQRKFAIYKNGEPTAAIVNNLPKNTKFFAVVCFYSGGDKAKLLPSVSLPKKFPKGW